MLEPLKGKKQWAYDHEIHPNPDDVHPACRVAVFYEEDVKSAVEWLLKEIQKKINEVFYWIEALEWVLGEEEVKENEA